MGQATDPLGRPADVSPADYRYAQPGQDGDYEATTNHIETEIEQTRAEMSETINAIQERLSPQHIAEQAREAVYDATIGTAKGAGLNMIETIKRNPIPAAIAALSIGWLVRKSGQQRNGYDQQSQYRGYQRFQPYEQPYYNADYRPASAYYQEYEGDGGEGLGERISDAAAQVRDQAQHAVSQVADQAQHMAGRVKTTARELRYEAMDQANYLGDRAGQQFEQAGDWLQDTMHERPMALGAVAFALGTAVGLTLPATPVENRVMGEARDSLVEKVQETAQQTMEKVQSVAQDATQAVQETVLEAREQGR